MIIDDIKYIFTNYHIIPQYLINDNIIIELYNKKKINFRLKEENITFYIELDITKIEIGDLDNKIKDIKYLQLDLNYLQGYDQYKNTDVFSIQYPKDPMLVSRSQILEIIKIPVTNNYEFKYTIDTEQGSSGSPITLANTLKVIAIHKQGNIRDKYNYGTFIGEIFKNDKLKFEKEELKKGNGENNNYIIGQINISKDDINKEIIIINSYEEHIRGQYFEEIEEKYRNEKEIKECIIEINNIKLSSFSYFHKFEKDGIYNIKYTFKNLLTNCNHMFESCRSLINLDLSNFNTQNVKSMESMFCFCFSLEYLNLSNFNTQNVENMTHMFYFCTSLKNLNLSTFNTQKVKGMSCMFSNCSSLKDLNLSNFDTQNVTVMMGMFSDCKSLKDLNLSNFNTENVVHMGSMFSGCSSLINLNLSNFYTQNVEMMCNMFLSCPSLQYLDLSNFNTQKVQDMGWMFTGCESLKKEGVITKDQRILEKIKDI